MTLWHDYTEQETGSQAARDMEDAYWAELDRAEAVGAWIEAQAALYGDEAIDDDAITLAEGWDRDPDDRDYTRRLAA